MSEEDRRIIKVEMPSQTIIIDSYINETDVLGKLYLEIDIIYTHPDTKTLRNVHREPYKSSFSRKYFDKELETYIVQEAMSDLMDNRHAADWIE